MLVRQYSEDEEENEDEEGEEEEDLVLELNRLPHCFIFFVPYRSVSTGAEMLHCLIVVEYQ